jgi:hypothetical protein
VEGYLRPEVLSGSVCLACEKAKATDHAHFPRAVGMGRSRKKVVDLPRVWMCRECHVNKQHAGHEQTIRTLIEKAPMYWRETGQWEQAKEIFEAWVSRRDYLRAVR